VTLRRKLREVLCDGLCEDVFGEGDAVVLGSLGGRNRKRSCDVFGEGGCFERSGGIGDGEAGAAYDVLAAVELLEGKLELRTFFDFQGGFELEDGEVRLSFLGVDAPGGVYVVVYGFGDGPIGLIEIGCGAFDLYGLGGGVF
jgi:hypothetical protein